MNSFTNEHHQAAERTRWNKDPFYAGDSADSSETTNTPYLRTLFRPPRDKKTYRIRLTFGAANRETLDQNNSVSLILAKL